MRKGMMFIFHFSVFLFALIGYAYAADESFPDRFLGSPLLILTAIIAIYIIALVYHKMRK